ncbi:MAG: radical SAM protein [Methyloligellaceae bacterium]
MAYSYAAPTGISFSDKGLALTYIVPASKCNLNCSFCVIKQRQEALQNTLSISDYLNFTKNIIEKEQVAVISVQGYEPLLPESWPYTKAIMEQAASYGLPRSFITNGYLLEERAQDVIDLKLTGISVSVDSCSPIIHDRLRGKEGAFAKTVRGIQKLNRLSDDSMNLTVCSVLMPKKRVNLKRMPELLDSIGVRSWGISPLMRIGRNEIGGITGAGEEIIEDLLYFSEEAKKYGISVFLNDELSAIPNEHIADLNEQIVRRFKRPDGLIRLNANGACSIGTEILQQVSPTETPVWDPSKLSPAAFLDSIRNSSPDISIAAA